MARSTYIYLIFSKEDLLLSAHTVKREAHEWLLRSIQSPENTKLMRMRDGLGMESNAKALDHIRWDENLLLYLAQVKSGMRLSND